jgi:hypothetical protein
MRKPLIIGDNLFKTKKEALLFYKEILNKYSFADILSSNDKDAILDLIKYDESFEIDFIATQNDYFLEVVRIGKAQFNTKCFEIIWNDGLEEFISYTQIINRHQTNNKLYFVKACRNCIQDDLRRVKQKYFDSNSTKGKVKCQETSEFLKWEDLVVDHRQPNTFSVIVDRFLEVRSIFIDEVEYKEVNNILYFKDEILNNEFKEYHKEKAILRVVKKELNSSRTQLAKLKIFKNDLKIE